MTEVQLAELEVHLAAEADLPTAFAAVQYDTGRPLAQSKAVQSALLIGLAVGVLLWLYFCA